MFPETYLMEMIIMMSNPGVTIRTGAKVPVLLNLLYFTIVLASLLVKPITSLALTERNLLDLENGIN